LSVAGRGDDSHQVVIPGVDEVRHELGRSIEAVVVQTIPQPGQCADEEHHDHVAQIGSALVAPDKPQLERSLGCITSRCFAQ
jgi:hypothetical protein